LERGDLPVLKRPIRANDIVVWRPEPKFPRLVTDVAPKKASLIEPGDGDGAKPLRIHADFLDAIDIAAIRETAGNLSTTCNSPLWLGGARSRLCCSLAVGDREPELSDAQPIRRLRCQ
jgi:hypothetical protein